MISRAQNYSSQHCFIHVPQCSSDFDDGHWLISVCKEQSISPVLGPELCSLSPGGGAGWGDVAKGCQVGKVWLEETQVGHLTSHLSDFNFDRINKSVTLQ